MTKDETPIDNILPSIVGWARSKAEIFGLALVGSQARGTARRDSDIDLVVLVREPEQFRSDTHWLGEIDWTGRQITSWHDAQYGLAWSRHVELQSQYKIEFTFCPSFWAATNPIDPGTMKVVSNGCRILLDKAQLLSALLRAASL